MTFWGVLLDCPSGDFLRSAVFKSGWERLAGGGFRDTWGWRVQGLAGGYPGVMKYHSEDLGIGMHGYFEIGLIFGYVS